MLDADWDVRVANAAVGRITPALDDCVAQGTFINAFQLHGRQVVPLDGLRQGSGSREEHGAQGRHVQACKEAERAILDLSSGAFSVEAAWGWQA